MIQWILEKYKQFSKPKRRWGGMLTQHCSIQIDPDTVVTFNQHGWSYTASRVIKWTGRKWVVVYDTKSGTGFPYPRALCGTKLDYSHLKLVCPHEWFGWGIAKFVAMQDEELLQHAHLVLELYKLDEKQ